MLDIYSQLIKDASNQSLYNENEFILSNEEDEEKRLEAEKLEIERIRESEKEKLQTIQSSIEQQEAPTDIYAQLIQDASNQDTDLSLKDISTSRKIKYGAAQEPTIFGNIYRLGRAGVESLFSDESFNEASRRIEQERQSKIFEEYPEFYGREEDLTVLSGRMGIALADPATFFIPWVKIAKAGRLANIAAGSTVAAGDAALREKALYGEVSPTIVGLAGTLGGASSAIGSLIATRLGGNKVKENIRINKEDGTEEIIDLVDTSTPLVPPLNKKTTDDLNILNREVFEDNQPTIESMSKNFESLGAAYQKIDLLKQETRQMKEILTPHLHQMKQIRKSHIVFDASKKLVFKPSKLLSAKKGNQIFNQINKNKNELKSLQKEVDQINYFKHPEDVAIVGVDSLIKAHKKGLLEGKLGESLTRAMIHELVRPLLGATSGGLVGIYLSDDETDEGLYTGLAVGAFAGFFSKRLELTRYNLPVKIKKLVNGEIEKQFRNSYRTNLKSLLAGTHATYLQSRNPVLQKFGLEFLRNQGASLKTGQTLKDSVEGLSDISLEHFTQRLFNIIGDNDDATILAAGRILQQRNMPSKAKYSFLEKGDLQNEKAVSLADNLFNLDVSFKNYMKKAGISFTELESYGLTQILDRNKLDSIGFNKAVDIIKNSFKVQSINNKGKKVAGFSKVNKDGSLEPIKVLSDKQAESLAINYLQKSDNLRRQLVLDSERLLAKDATEAFIKNNGVALNKNENIVHSARFFENERVLFDQEARALAKDLFIQDPIATHLSLFDNSVKVAEFSRRYGARGEGIQALKKQLDDYYSGIDKNWKLNKSLKKLYTNDINDISKTVNAYFGVYGQLPEGEMQRTFVLALQTLLATTKLTKVAIPSLGDTIQTIQNSGYSAAFKSAIKQMKGGPKPSEALGQRAGMDDGLFGRAFSNRQYNGALHRELDNWSLQANNGPQRALVEFQRKFFEIIQLGRVTRFAREFAFDAGAFRVYDLGRIAAKKGKLSRAQQREIDLFGLTKDEVSYLGKFKNFDEAFEDKLGQKFVERAGRRSADRDALIPQIGNRRLFSQSRNPAMKFAGSFLSWAQAKASQTNALVRRIEDGDGKLAVMMLASLPLYAAVRDLYVAVNPSKDFRENHGQFFKAIDEGDLKMLTDAMADSAVFSGQTMPWYIDKIINSFKFYGNDAIETIYPVFGMVNDLFAAIQTGVTGKPRTAGVKLVETVAPFGKDITRSEEIGELIGLDESILEAAKVEDKDVVPVPRYAKGGKVRKQYFEGQKVSEDYPVSDVEDIPADRINPYTGESYSGKTELEKQMEELIK
jgi:hypothetical protein